MAEENPATDTKMPEPDAHERDAKKSEADEMKPKSDDGTAEAGLLRTLASTVLSSIPVLSAIVFLAVAIKVFRASNMETVTTVAIVSTADVVAVWVALVIAFYTISWPILVVFLLPVALTTGLLFGQSHDRWMTVSWTRRLLGALRLLSAVAAVVAILFVALSPTVWLPLRAVDLKPGYSAQLNGKAQAPPFAAFLLSSNSKTTSLLLNSPRGVVEISTAGMQPNPPLCILPVSPLRWLFLRASQVVHADHDYGSPYEICP